jgi:hypothetical protein
MPSSTAQWPVAQHNDQQHSTMPSSTTQCGRDQHARRTSKRGGGGELLIVHGHQQVPAAAVTFAAVRAQTRRDLNVKKSARGAVENSGTLEPNATRPLRGRHQGLRNWQMGGSWREGGKEEGINL